MEKLSCVFITAFDSIPDILLIDELLGAIEATMPEVVLCIAGGGTEVFEAAAQLIVRLPAPSTVLAILNRPIS